MKRAALWLVLLVGCAAPDEGPTPFSPCAIDGDCPTDTECVEGIGGGRMCSLVCEFGESECNPIETSARMHCMARPLLPLGSGGVCAPRCPSLDPDRCETTFGVPAVEFSSSSSTPCVCSP